MVAGFFHPKDGGNRFLRNVSASLLEHTASHYMSLFFTIMDLGSIKDGQLFDHLSD
jgi:hypothetical protein